MNALPDVSAMSRDHRVAIADACRNALDSLGAFLALVEADPTIMGTLRDSASPLALPADGGASNVVAVDFRPVETVEIETVPAPVEIEPETRDRIAALESGVAAVEAALAVAEPEPVDPAIAAMNAAAADITADHFPEGYAWPRFRYLATAPRAALAAAVAACCEAIERRNTIPILSNVLLQRTAPGVMTVRGTDLDMEVAVDIEADVEDGFAVTLHAHTFRDVLAKSKAGSVDLVHHVAEERLAITLDASRSALATQPASYFPDIAADMKAAVGFTLPNDVLCDGFARTAFAISTEETRYYLNGIYLHIHRSRPSAPGSLRMVATDGHRLAGYDLPVAVGGRLADMPGVILPRKLTVVAGRLLAVKGKGKKREAPADVHVAVTDTKVRFACGAVRIVSKLIDGTFPDYTRVIPAANDKRLTVDTPDMVAAIDQVSTISDTRGRAVRLAMGDDSMLRLSVENPDSGVTATAIGATWVTDNGSPAAPMETGFNSRYLLDILAQFKGQVSVTFQMADPGSPSLITAGEGAPFFVLMPMRV